MSIIQQLKSLSLLSALSVVAIPQQTAAQEILKGVKNIVLVHGAFADGSSWSKVIPILYAKGFNVVAVQNPLTSFVDDVAATRRAIDQMDGPVLLVGHSYGGMVISEAGKHPRVAGLVYVAALIPEEGQNVDDVNGAMPLTGVGPEFIVSPDGFLSLSQKGINEFFAQDVSTSDRKLIYATQTPWAVLATKHKVETPAWTTRASWAIVASNDGMINPDLQRFKAKLIKAKTLELATSHVPMISQPGKVAAYIISAASEL